MSQTTTAAMDFTNPMLLNPMQGQDGRHVPPLAARTDPLPLKKMPHKMHWVCTQLHHKMNRTDGKVLAFQHGHLATDDFYDCAYIAAEIDAGNPFLRQATEQEIRIYNMRVDPTGTVRAELQPQMEEQIRGQLEAELRAELMTKMNDIGLTEEQQEKLLARSKFDPDSEVAVTQKSKTDEQRIAGTGDRHMDMMRQRLLVKTNTATVSIPQSTPAPILGGIQGTDKMANAADSNSGTAKS